MTPLPTNPYAAALAGRDPLESMRDAAARIRALVEPWSERQFERSYAPGKWSARQILLHLAQSEIAFGARARMALTTANYMAQPFDQDAWMAKEAGEGAAGPAISGRDAADALLGLTLLNHALYAALSPSDRQKQFSHPEYGALTVDWLIHQAAGHLAHHVGQLEEIATR